MCRWRKAVMAGAGRLLRAAARRLLRNRRGLPSLLPMTVREMPPAEDCPGPPGNPDCTGRHLCDGVQRLMALALEAKEAMHHAGRTSQAEDLIEKAVVHLSASETGRRTLQQMQNAAARGSPTCWAWAYQRLLRLFVPKIFEDVAILELDDTALARQLGEFLDESGVFFHGLATQQALPFGQLQKRAFEMAFAECFRRVLLRAIEAEREADREPDVYALAVGVFNRLSRAFARRLWVSRLDLDMAALKTDAYNVLAGLHETGSVPDLSRAMAAIQEAEQPAAG